MDGMPHWARSASLAFLASAIAALVVDVVLHVLIGLVNVSPPASSAPWWVTAHVVERGRWVALAAILALVSRGARRAAPDRARIWQATGIAVMTIPLLWVLANWIVTAILFTLARRWDIDGRIFLEAGYYRSLLVDYVPWLLGGAAVVAASAHVE
jgi:hypothetical protein